MRGSPEGASPLTLPSTHEGRQEHQVLDRKMRRPTSQKDDRINEATQETAIVWVLVLLRNLAYTAC